MTTNQQHPPPVPVLPAELPALIESLLFVADHPIPLTDLATALDVSMALVETALNQLTDFYQTRYLRLQQHQQKVQLVTAPEVAPAIEKFLGLGLSAKLSPAALEVLGIIAYKQPIIRPDIEAIRGVSSDGVLRNLLSKGLVEEVGRLDTVGHPIQYGTTFEFLKYFGLSSLDNLPPLPVTQPDEAEQSTEQPAT